MLHLPTINGLKISGASAICALMLTAAMPGSAAWAGKGLTGVWYDDTGRGAVQLYNCKGRICGKIFWLKQPISAKTGKPLRDKYNPTPAKRSRSICGLQVIGGVAKGAGGGWDGGWIYDPKVGKSYNAAIDIADANRIRVTGYLGLRLLGKSFVWKRAPASLPACKRS